MNHIVLFDGTSHRPWGRYLEAQPEPAPRQPPLRALRPESIVDQVLSAIRAAPQTRDGVAVRLGISAQQAGCALSDLVGRGYLRAEDSPYGAKAFHGGCRTIYRAVIR